MFARSETESAVLCTHRHLVWCFVLALLFGCETQQPHRNATGSRLQAQPASALSEEKVTAIREAVEASGGTLQCDANGQPVEVDLAAARGSADAAALAAALDCLDLRVLRVRAAQLSAADLAGIATLVNLEELTLQDAAVTDQLLARFVAEIPSLKRLTLRNTPNVTDLGIAQLGKLSHLTHLALIDLKLTSNAVKAIAAFPAVVSLDLRMCNTIQGDQLAALADAPRLKELKLGGYGIDDATMTILATLPRLESLTVEDASIGANGLNQLASNEQAARRFHTLAFARCSALTDDALQALGRFTHLRRLTLRDMPVTGECLRAIVAPERLEQLSLNQTFLTDEALETIAACQALKRLELAQNFLTPTAMEKIGTLANLQVLNLSECGLSDEQLKPLSGLKKLSTLIVNGNPDVSPEVVAALVNPSETD